MGKPNSKKTFASKLDELVDKENVTVRELSDWFADKIASVAVLLAMEECMGLPPPPNGEKALQALDEAGLRAIEGVLEELRRAARTAWPKHRPPKVTVVNDDPAGAWTELMANVREIIAVYAECGGDLSKLQLDTWTAPDQLALQEAAVFIEKVKLEMEKELKARANRPN